MPTPSNPDSLPAWLKGDLPAEPDAAPAPPMPAEHEEPALTPPPVSRDAKPEPETTPSSSAKPTRLGDEPADSLADADAEALLEAEALAEVFAAVADELIAEPAARGSASDQLDPSQTAISPREAMPGVVGLSSPSPEQTEVREPEAPAPPPIELPAIDPLGLDALVESLLFVADGAVPVARLAEALEASTRDVEAALVSLAAGYRQRGLNLQRFRDKVQLTTSPAAAGRVERFLGLAALTPLSRAALEALAIVAYQQPVTRPQIEAIRGVNSDSVIKNLLSKGLIEESGRAEGPGRPVLYSTTPEFMQHFGLSALTDLPPLALPQTVVNPSPEAILKG